MVEGLDCKITSEFCIGGKHHKSQLPKSSSSCFKSPLDLLHIDVCEKMGKKSMGGAEHLLMIRLTMCGLIY